MLHCCCYTQNVLSLAHLLLWDACHCRQCLLQAHLYAGQHGQRGQARVSIKATPAAAAAAQNKEEAVGALDQWHQQGQRGQAGIRMKSKAHLQQQQHRANSRQIRRLWLWVHFGFGSSMDSVAKLASVPKPHLQQKATNRRVQERSPDMQNGCVT
jgi:hypothetical protein